MLFLGIPKGLPYGYYTLLRVVVFVTSGLIAVAAYKSGRRTWLIALGLIALIFNPIITIHLDKGMWILIDLIVAIIFFILLSKMRLR
jgi:hypothetical protein